MPKLICILFIITHQYIPMQDSAKLWEQINETTWRKNEGFLGRGYTFFELKTGEKSCIVQFYLSGLYTSSEKPQRFKVNIKNDTIQLLFLIKNNSNISNMILYEELIFKDGTLMTSNKKHAFNLSSKTPLIYDYKNPSSGKKIPLDEFKED